MPKRKNIIEFKEKNLKTITENLGKLKVTYKNI